MRLPDIWPEPYLVRTAIRWLESVIQPRWRIFEWGSGASSVWFSRRCSEVITVDHDLAWTKAVRQAVAAERAIITICTPEDDPLWPMKYVDQVRGPWDVEFDLIVIDGHDATRALCAQAALDVAKPGSYILLDNAGAKAHAEATRVLNERLGENPATAIIDPYEPVPVFDTSKFARMRFIGEVAMPGPIQKTETCVWRVP